MSSPGFTWTGNYVPVYYFWGYAYDMQAVIPLAGDLSHHSHFGGWGNCSMPTPELFGAVAFGGMGINTDGIYAEPPAPSAVEGITWGAIRAMYRD